MIWINLFCGLNIFKHSCTSHNMVTTSSFDLDTYNINNINSTIKFIPLVNLTTYKKPTNTRRGDDERFDLTENDEELLHEIAVNHEKKQLLEFLLDNSISIVEKMETFMSHKYLFDSFPYDSLNITKAGLYDDYEFEF